MDKLSLLTAKNRRLCKIIKPDHDTGGIRKIDYDDAKYFDVDEVEISSLAELAELLELLQTQAAFVSHNRRPTRSQQRERRPTDKVSLAL
jgi:hypothetical protein